jgi:hypothetical protein
LAIAAQVRLLAVKEFIINGVNHLSQSGIAIANLVIAGQRSKANQAKRKVYLLTAPRRAARRDRPGAKSRRALSTAFHLRQLPAQRRRRRRRSRRGKWRSRLPVLHLVMPAGGGVKLAPLLPVLVIANLGRRPAFGGVLLNEPFKYLV